MGNPLLQGTQNWNFPKTELSQGGGRGIATVFRARALPNFRLSKKLIYCLPAEDSLTLGTRIAIRGRPPKHFGNLTNQQARKYFSSYRLHQELPARVP